MADVTNELMFALLKTVNADISLLREVVRGVREEMTAMRGNMPAIQRDVNNIYERMGTMEVRADRIERRLELTETPA